MLSVREKIVRRMIDLEAPEDPLKVAEALERTVGEPDAVVITLSRRRLRALLCQAVELGIDQQREAARARLTEGLAAILPRGNAKRGLRRLLLVIVAALAVPLFFRLWVSANRSDCGYGNRGAECFAGGLPIALILTVIWTALFAGVLVLLYRAVVWVWRGFKDGL